ncbi:MAG TPA: type-F conjugative transfer system secretin TraK [Aquabacterium sp.]|nr:type-F conjugative transfer system secretin TraK [Aquabacterium sp.]
MSGLACTPAHALQLLDAQDGVAVEAILSTREPTRIRIDGAAITEVVGSVHASGCQPRPGSAGDEGGIAASNSPGGAIGAVQTPATPHPAAEALLECDLDKGEVYIRPLGDSRKPLNLFIASAHATYTLVLRRADTPADTIVIRDRSRLLAAAAAIPPHARAATSPALGAIGEPEPAADAAASRALPRGAAAQHVRAIKALLTAMATDRVPADLRVEDLLQPMQLWAEARLTLVRRFEGRGLVGELFLLQNTSAAPLVLSEPEFDRPDDNTWPNPRPADAPSTRSLAQAGPVLGVAVARHNLRPGDQTPVYVIRQGVRP